MRHEEGRIEESANKRGSMLIGALLLAAATAPWTASPAVAAPPATTIGYQPMVSTGLAAQNPFEVWFVFDKSSDPTVPGYAIPAGASIRFVFPREFTPQPGPLGAVMLHGWSQGPIDAKFTTALDANDPRVVVVHFDEAIAAGPPDRPGLKAIHLRTGEINPPAGDYPITLEFRDAGALTGTTKAVAHITPKPVPNVAAYNSLHKGQNEDWQRVKAGAEVPLPIDFLVTLPTESRSFVSLKPGPDGHLQILSDRKPIGTIRTKGVPIALRPQMFGPGQARLGIIEVHAKAATTQGQAQVIAALDGGTESTINLIVE